MTRHTAVTFTFSLVSKMASFISEIIHTFIFGLDGICYVMIYQQLLNSVGRGVFSEG
jgi:hypothetical protein